MTNLTTNDILNCVEALESLARNPPPSLLADDALRRRFREASKNASIAVEKSGDSIHRIANTALQLSMAKVGVKKKIFETLAGDLNPMSCSQLAAKTGVDPVLMKRLMRYYQSYKMVAEVGEDQFTASNVTQALSSPQSSGIDYFADMISQSFYALPEWLEKNDYQNTVDIQNVPFMLGHGTELNPFQFLQANPAMMGTFLAWMAQQRYGLPIWLDEVHFDTNYARNSTDDTVLFVDVGGAAGHQCIAFRERYSADNLPGRVILQDTPAMIGQVQKAHLPHGIESMAHDFFTPQPIKGARAYYMRNIMHDFPDEECKKILKHLISAMDENSVIIIDDMRLPEKGTPWRAAQLDVAMLTCLAAKERSEKEWEVLINKAGLEIVEIRQYTEENADCAIICKPKIIGTSKETIVATVAGKDKSVGDSDSGTQL